MVEPAAGCSTAHSAMAYGTFYERPKQITEQSPEWWRDFVDAYDVASVLGRCCELHKDLMEHGQERRVNHNDY
jgi:hypothetical protein